jgi:hypothetical protein
MEVEDEEEVDEAEDDVIYGENDELDEIPPVVKGQNVEPKLIDDDFHEDLEEDEEVTLDDTEDEEKSGNFITGFLKWIMSWFG